MRQTVVFRLAGRARPPPWRWNGRTPRRPSTAPPAGRPACGWRTATGASPATPPAPARSGGSRGSSPTSRCATGSAPPGPGRRSRRAARRSSSSRRRIRAPAALAAEEWSAPVPDRSSRRAASPARSPLGRAPAAGVEWTADGVDGWQACASARRRPLAAGELRRRHARTCWRGAGGSPGSACAVALVGGRALVAGLARPQDARRFPSEILDACPSSSCPPRWRAPARSAPRSTATPGLWGGVPAPDLALQWCRDGAAIPGATGTAYVPGPEDDLTRANLPGHRHEPRGQRHGRDGRARDHPCGARGGGDDPRGDLRPAFGRADRRRASPSSGARALRFTVTGAGASRRRPERRDQHPDRRRRSPTPSP